METWRRSGEKSRAGKGGDNNKVEAAKTGGRRRERSTKKERRSILTSGSPLPGWA